MKLSDYLEEALNELDYYEDHPDYVIDTVYYYENIEGKCHICLAGCLMAKRTNDPKLWTCLTDFDDYQYLSAINDLRTGKILKAAERVGVETKLTDRKVPYYGELGFKKAMLEIVEDLRNEGN